MTPEPLTDEELRALLDGPCACEHAGPAPCGHCEAVAELLTCRAALREAEAVVVAARKVIDPDPIPDDWVGGGLQYDLLGLEEALRAYDEATK